MREIRQQHAARFEKLHVKRKALPRRQYELDCTFSHENDAIPVVTEDNDTEALATLELERQALAELLHDREMCLEHSALGQVVLEDLYTNQKRNESKLNLCGLKDDNEVSESYYRSPSEASSIA